MAKNAAVLHGVTKNYPSFTLGPVDLCAPRGSIVGLVGENGAGKTTLLKILCGASPAGSGTAELLGKAPSDPAVRARVGVVFEDAYFPEMFTAQNVGKSMAGIFGTAWSGDAYNAYLRRFGLQNSKTIREYSRGMRMKLSLATALAHDPELLILDEATAGLDPVVRGEMLDLFLEFIQDERRSILMSSHITDDLEQVADEIAYLHHGKLLFCKNKDELLQQYGLLRCAETDLQRLPEDCIVFTKRGAYGCETLVTDRAAVRAALPDAVCDPAKIDDIMRFYSGRDTQ